MEVNKSPQEAPEYRVSKKCRKCGFRLYDKVSPATGYITIKCPRCDTFQRINLAYRIGSMHPRISP